MRDPLSCGIGLHCTIKLNHQNTGAVAPNYCLLIFSLKKAGFPIMFEILIFKFQDFLSIMLNTAWGKKDMNLLVKNLVFKINVYNVSITTNGYCQRNIIKILRKAENKRS